MLIFISYLFVIKDDVSEKRISTRHVVGCLEQMSRVLYLLKNQLTKQIIIKNVFSAPLLPVLKRGVLMDGF